MNTVMADNYRICLIIQLSKPLEVMNTLIMLCVLGIKLKKCYPTLKWPNFHMAILPPSLPPFLLSLPFSSLLPFLFFESRPQDVILVGLELMILTWLVLNLWHCPCLWLPARQDRFVQCVTKLRNSSFTLFFKAALSTSNVFQNSFVFVFIAIVVLRQCLILSTVCPRLILSSLPILLAQLGVSRL